MAKAKIDKKDFRNLEVKDWNATTFREYIKHLNEERFGVPAVTFNVRTENSMISSMIKEYGKEITKAFVEECVRKYKPNGNYPTVNFATMYSYMKGYELPRVLDAQRKKMVAQEAVKVEKQIETEIDVNDFF